MWYLYLDESGDLGFDFSTKNPSTYFTLSILLVKSVGANRDLLNAASKTRRRKLRGDGELKGSKTSLAVKKHFYAQVETTEFEIYALTLNKRRVQEQFPHVKDRIYNLVARNVLDRLPIQVADTRVELVIDKSKNNREVAEFNTYVMSNLQARLDPRVPLDIYHRRSHENLGLQIADLFAWGIFRRHEYGDWAWRNCYQAKIAYDDRYL